MRGVKSRTVGEVITTRSITGLNVVNVNAPGESAGLSAVLRQYPEADVVNLTSYVSDPLLGVITRLRCGPGHSGHEPSAGRTRGDGSGGSPVTGGPARTTRTRIATRLGVETDDTIELVTELN